MAVEGNPGNVRSRPLAGAAFFLLSCGAGSTVLVSFLTEPLLLVETFIFMAVLGLPGFLVALWVIKWLQTRSPLIYCAAGALNGLFAGVGFALLMFGGAEVSTNPRVLFGFGLYALAGAAAGGIYWMANRSFPGPVRT